MAYDEDEDGDPREYTASALCFVAGCEQSTLRAWRRRNGLFPDTMLNGGWSRFSLADMKAAKLVVDLTSIGVSAQRAVDIAMEMLPIIEERGRQVPNWSHSPTREEIDARRKADDAINFVIRGNSRGDLKITRYYQQLSVSDLLSLEDHPTSLMIINLSNVTDISIERLSCVRPDEIDKSSKADQKAPAKRVSRKVARAKVAAKGRPKAIAKKKSAPAAKSRSRVRR